MRSLGVLKEASVVFPPLQAAAAGLFRVLEQIEVSSLEAATMHTKIFVQEMIDSRDDLGAMAHRITALAGLLQRYEGQTDDEDIRNRLDGMTVSVFFPLPVLRYSHIQLEPVRYDTIHV
jgi:hypothetical protein